VLVEEEGEKEKKENVGDDGTGGTPRATPAPTNDSRTIWPHLL